MNTQKITKKVWVKPELKPIGDVVKGGTSKSFKETTGTITPLS